MMTRKYSPRYYRQRVATHFVVAIVAVCALLVVGMCVLTLLAHLGVWTWQRA